MKSFQLLKTNILLTTNFKINIDLNYNMYFETIKSNSNLSNSKYNHYKFNKDSYIEDELPRFYDKLPKEEAFFVKNEKDNDIVYNDYSNQFDDIYNAGSNYIFDTWYNEEFEYFAPLFVRKNNLPDGFIVLRVDGPSVYNDVNNIYELGSVNNKNFRNEIVNKWKCVQYFDMTNNSNFGYWLDNNINNNERFPIYSFELDVRKITFSRWFGMDYETGVYTQKSMYLDKTLNYEQPHFKLEKIITEGFKNNSIIYPHIFNFNFLFNDTPATPEKLNKYTVNRYFGFYVDELKFVTNLTSYITPDLISGTTLYNNIIIYGPTGLTWDECDKDFSFVIPSINPFNIKWDDNKTYFIYIKDNLHEVNRFKDNDKWVYKIISDEILDDYWNTGITYNKTVNIEYNKSELYSYIEPMSNDFTIDPYISCDNLDSDMYGDLYLIQINDKLHVIKVKVTDSIFGSISKYIIQSDYAIVSNSKKLKYWIGGENSSYYKEYNVENINRKPLTYPIFKIKFLDIKDFDYDRVNTNFSDFDYEKTKYNHTNEEKLYVKELRSNTYPKSIKREKRGTEFQDKPIISSSEYISDEELFEMKINGDISDIWVKNQIVCKWGFMGSISHSDYPYKLNNNSDVGGYYNRTTDVFNTNPNVFNKNLDYFYRIGNLLSGDTIENKSLYYLKQSINIQTDYIDKFVIKDDVLYNQNGGHGFNISTYFEVDSPSNYDFDYFDYFFSNYMVVEKNNLLFKDIYKKYSIFYGDENFLPVTLFKGLKIELNEIVNIKRDNNNSIFNINTKNTGKYNNYKFSIILNDVYYKNSLSDPYCVNGVNNFDGVLNVTGNGIHIIINDIYKNILIIINMNIILNPDLIYPSGLTFNYVNYFGEKDIFYNNTFLNGDLASNNYNSKIITASNFINAINNLNGKSGFDNFITFYNIYKDDNITKYKKGLINGTNDFIVPPIILRIIKPDSIDIKRNSYNIELIDGPKTSKLFLKNTYIEKLSNIDEPLSRKIILNNSNDDLFKIYRYSGPYEPIFKDIKVFKSGVFCFTDYSTSINLIEENIEKSSTNGKNSTLTMKHDQNSWKNWQNINNICNDSSLYVNLPPNISGYTYYLLLNGFNFDIPINSNINGVEVKIERKSYNNVDLLYNIYTKDNYIGLINNYNPTIDNLSNNKSTETIWDNEYDFIIYGDSGDTWGLDLNSTIINSNNFGVAIVCEVSNYNSNLQSTLLAEIKCVSVEIYYEYNKVVYSYKDSIYFDKNLKFDEDVLNFGKIDEIIYSKVNIDNKNILKFKDAKYPIVDQFGYAFNDSFIFKSNWDTKFYFNTLDNFEDDSTNYFTPSNNVLKINKAESGQIIIIG